MLYSRCTAASFCTPAELSVPLGCDLRPSAGEEAEGSVGAEDA